MLNARILRLSSVELAEFCRIGVVDVVEVLPDVGEINYISESDVLVRSVHTCERLKKIMVFQLAAKIQSLQPWRVKTRQEHIIDYQQIWLCFLPKLQRDISPLLFVVIIVQYEFYLQTRRIFVWHGSVIFRNDCANLRHIGGMSILVLVRSHLIQTEHHAGLFVRLAYDHASKRRVIHLQAEAFEVTDDIVEQSSHIPFILNNGLPLNILLLNLYRFFEVRPNFL